MSIELFPFDTTRCSLKLPAPRTPRPISQRRLEANRRNARRSTGPRTAEGKKRVSQNARARAGTRVPGLANLFGSRLPSEDGPAYNTFIEELREQMIPRSIMQLTLFPQIADLVWRLYRLPEAQSRLFEQERLKASQGAAPSPGRSDSSDATEQDLTPADILARRFSDDPTRNGFLLMGRYERSLQNQLLRYLRQYEHEQKARPTTPHHPDEPPCPREGDQPAWTKEKAEAQRRYFETPQGKAEL